MIGQQRRRRQASQSAPVTEGCMGTSKKSPQSCPVRSPAVQLEVTETGKSVVSGKMEALLAVLKVNWSRLEMLVTKKQTLTKSSNTVDQEETDKLVAGESVNGDTGWLLDEALEDLMVGNGDINESIVHQMCNIDVEVENFITEDMAIEKITDTRDRHTPVGPTTILQSTGTYDNQRSSKITLTEDTLC